MRASRCPRCSTLVRYEEHDLPVCPTCGYPDPDVRIEPADLWAEDPESFDHTVAEVASEDGDGPFEDKTTNEDAPGASEEDETHEATAAHAEAEHVAFAAPSIDPDDALLPTPPKRPPSRLGMPPSDPDAPAPAPLPRSPRGRAGPLVHESGVAGPSASAKAVASLIFGLASIFLTAGGIITAILAIVFGLQARSEIERHPETYTGKGMATWGIALGIAFFVIVPILIVLVLLGVLGLALSA